jgi:hypothetical protein
MDGRDTVLGKVHLRDVGDTDGEGSIVSSFTEVTRSLVLSSVGDRSAYDRYQEVKKVSVALSCVDCGSFLSRAQRIP